MFEFDEHFAELEAMESELALFQSEDHCMLPSWSYIGADVWKLDFDTNAVESPQEWRLQTVDMA
jgi:hypothetical protein